MHRSGIAAMFCLNVKYILFQFLSRDANGMQDLFHIISYAIRTAK